MSGDFEKQSFCDQLKKGYPSWLLLTIYTQYCYICLPLSEGKPVSHSKSPGVGGAGLLTLGRDGKMYEHASNVRMNFVIAWVKYVTNFTLSCRNK